MSEDRAEQTIKELQEKAEKVGVTLKPETIENIRQKLQREQQQLQALQSQGEQTPLEETDWAKYTQQRVDLEKQLEDLDDPSLQISEEERQQRREEVKHKIEQLREQRAPKPTDGAKPAVPSLRRTSDFSGMDRPATPQPTEGFQPRAFGERGMAERAESGPEKKDKELYLAEKRLKG
jgi:hypothetical protein